MNEPVGRLRLPRTINRPGDRRRRRTLLHEVADAILPGLSGPGDRPWRLLADVAGESGTTAAVIGPRDRPSGVLKLTDDAAGRDRLVWQAEVLTALHDDVRLETWRHYLPQALTSAAHGDWWVSIESRMRGRDGREIVADPARRACFTAEAVAVIGDLHRRTATVCELDDERLRRWIREPAARVRRGLTRPDQRRRLDIVTASLVTAFAGRRVALGWVHGDYCPDNILLEGDRISAVVDWCEADPRGLVILDVANFLLHTERRASGKPLGRVIRSWLTGRPIESRAMLAAYQRSAQPEIIPDRAVVLLAWLQHVAANFAQSPRYAANPVWMWANLHSVLRAAT